MVEENTNEMNLKRIRIKTESGTKWFKTWQDFSSWVEEQRNFYSFITNSNNNERSFQTSLSRNWQSISELTQRDLASSINKPEKYAQSVDELVAQFQQKLANKEIFTTEAPFALFVQDLAKKDSMKATYALAYFLDYNFGNLDLKGIKSIQAAIDWERDFNGKIEYEEKALKCFLDRWDKEFEEKNDKLKQSQDRIDHIINRAEKLISTQEIRFEENVKTYEERLTSAFERANEELNNITRTYDENLALYSSVRYWGLQEKFHETRSISFGVATVIVASLVFWALYCYSNKFLVNEISKTPVSLLITISLMTTFGIWAIRICANLFMSHTHLRTDAQERRTMMHTYLALLRRGHGPKDDERQLILQTLFRPSSTGMIKEDAGPSNVVDLINRLAPGKSSST